MNGEFEVRTAQAGTVESMDCLVTISSSKSPREIKITGASALRFRSAIERTVNATLDALDAAPVCVDVRDNGALDVVLAARVEAAYRRLTRGEVQ